MLDLNLFFYSLYKAHIVPGLFLLALGHVGTNPYVHVAIITMSLGFNGAATLTNLQNAQDLAPNFAGTLYGLVNFIGSTSGFLTPMIMAYFTHEQVRRIVVGVLLGADLYEP